MKDSSDGLTLVDHLAELRDRLIRSAWAVIVAGAACLYFSEQLFDLIRHPVQAHVPGGALVFTNPMDKFLAHMKLSLVAGVILSCPVWIYQIWKFVAPGLYSHEKKYSIAFMGAGVILFLVGVSFAYFLVLPTAFEFLFNFGGSVDKPLITISEYLSFFSTMTLVFGAAFELPLVLVVLGAFGLISSATLKEKRRYAIVALATFAAVITPPDVLSMLLLLVPLVVLYEISIVLIRLVEGRRARSPAATSAG